MSDPDAHSVTNAAWLQAMAEAVPDDERLLVSTVPGDPEDAGAEAWNVRPWTWGAAAPPPTQNNYVCVSSFRRGPDGWRRRAAEFGRAVAFMIDDLNTKVPLNSIGALAPSLLTETSPGNLQAWYLFADPITDYDRFAALQAAFVARWAVGGKDPGMSGPNRVGRLPQGINGKRKYNGWQVRVVSYVPGRRVQVAELIEALGLLLIPRPSRKVPDGVTAEQQAERAAEFRLLVERVERARAFSKPAFGRNGRRPLLCPWYQRHTGQARNGAYLTEPNAQNLWWGSFVCFHSGTHNDNCHLRDLKRWAEELEDDRLYSEIARINSQQGDEK